MKKSETRPRRGIDRRTVLKGAVGAAALGTGISGFPAYLKAAGKPIKIGVPTIMSGRVAILGESAVAGAMMTVNRVNKAGGIEGRMLELVVRDSKGKPDEAARMTRDLVNNEGCEIILDGEASSGSFAVNEVVRDVKRVCVHTNSEASSLTADPKNRIPWAFRSARQGIHDAVGGGLYASAVAKAKGLKKWATISPDYAYGRENTAEFMEYLKIFAPEVEVTVQTWPKLFQPDYTENVTAILNAAPQAVYSCLWGGDLVAFSDQASLYGLFDQFESFAVNLGDYPVIKAVKSVPKGVHSGSRYHKDIPDTKENEAWYEEFMASGFKVLPTNWSWETATGMDFIVAGLKETGGNTDVEKLSAAMRGKTIDSPFGVGGKLTMRDGDNTLVNYMVGYSKTVPAEPYIVDYKQTAWADIFKYEAEWKTRNKFN